MSTQIQLIECPRDAMQGWKNFIPTAEKIKYLQTLLSVGFDTLDCGSFVSPKAIPQMADTVEVIKNLSLADSKTKLLVIVANLRGAQEAIAFDEISFLGFPFSISPTFQMRNTNSSIEESLRRVEDIQNICLQHRKQLVIYISMGFGNPYGDIYNEEIVNKWVEKIAQLGVKIISVADTVGMATPQTIHAIMHTLIPAYPDAQIGVHLHAAPAGWQEKVEAAFRAGCSRFDGALKGIGGCPMADDTLVGNMDTEKMITYFESQAVPLNLNKAALHKASAMASAIFA